MWVPAIPLFERFGVREYWIVDPHNEGVEVYSLSESRYVLVEAASTAQLAQS
jgi:Uma2 family endonuclease